MKTGKVVFLFMFVYLISTWIVLQSVSATEESIQYLKGNEFTNINKEVTINNQTYVVFSTNETVYFLKNNEIDFSINLTEVLFLEIMDDINNNGYDEILIMTASKDIDNIRLYDSKDLTLIYSYSPTMSAYHFSLGHYDEVISVDDYVLNGSQGVFISGYNVFKIDFKIKAIIWEYLGQNNLWDIESIGDINNDQETDYMISLEYSDVITLSGKTGKKIYQLEVSEPLFYQEKEIKTNIWSIKYDHEMKTIYAASENGHIYVLDVKNGTIKNDLTAVEVSSDDIRYYYDEKEDRQKLVYNYQVEIIDDIDGHGTKDVLFIQNEKGSLSIFSGESLQDDLGLLKITDDLEIYGDIKGNYQLGEYQGEDVLYILDAENDLHFYKIYSLSQKQFIDTIDFHSVGIYSLLPLSTGEFMRFHNRGLSIYDGENDLILYSKVVNSDFIFNGNHMLRIENNLRSCRKRGMGQVCWSGYTRFNMIDMTTNESEWIYNSNSTTEIIPLGEEAITREYIDEYILNTDYSTDLNNDGINDIVFISYKIDGIPKINAIDGKTGNHMGSHTIVIPKEDIRLNGEQITDEEYQDILSKKEYMDYLIINFNKIEDINGDGIDDYFVINDYGEIYFFDMTSGEVITIFTKMFQGLHDSDDYTTFIKTQKSSVNFTNYMMTEDLNNDSIHDFIIWRSASYSTYHFILEDGVYKTEFQNTIRLDYNWGYETSYVGDVDNDGLIDISYFMRNYTQITPSASVISSKTAEVYNVTDASGLLYMNNHDINDDGINDVISITRNDNKFLVNLFDLKSNNRIYQSDEFFVKLDSFWEEGEKPAIAYKTDEGEINIAILLTNKSRTKSKINIYNQENDLVNEIYLGMHIEDDDNEYNHLGNMKSFEQDGKIYIYGIMYNNTAKTYLYNVSDNQLVMVYDGEAEKLSIVDNQVILRDSKKQNIVAFDYTKHLNIENLTEQQKVRNNVTIQFSNADSNMVNVYVDNYLVGRTNDNQFSVKLLDGKHEIKISQIDQNGVELFYDVNVVVEKSMFYPIFLSVTTVTLIILTLIFTMKRKRYNINPA